MISSVRIWFYAGSSFEILAKMGNDVEAYWLLGKQRFCLNLPECPRRYWWHQVKVSGGSLKLLLKAAFVELRSSTTINIPCQGIIVLIRIVGYVWRVRYGCAASQVAFIAHRCLGFDLLDAVLVYSTRDLWLLRIILSFNPRYARRHVLCRRIQFSLR